MSAEMIHYPGLCDCCRRHGTVGVASSGYGPISFGWCMQCLCDPTHPEPEWILAYLYWEVGDEGKGLIADEGLPGTFRDGRYWTWREWADRFAEEFRPPETIDSYAWTGRYGPTPIERLREWWYNTSWRLRDLAKWVSKLRVKDGAVIVPDVGWRNDKADW